MAICSDYGDGRLSQPVIDVALQHHCCVVDAQSGLDRDRGATQLKRTLATILDRHA